MILLLARVQDSWAAARVSRCRRFAPLTRRCIFNLSQEVVDICLNWDMRAQNVFSPRGTKGFLALLSGWETRRAPTRGAVTREKARLTLNRTVGPGNHRACPNGGLPGGWRCEQATVFTVVNRFEIHQEKRQTGLRQLLKGAPQNWGGHRLKRNPSQRWLDSIGGSGRDGALGWDVTRGP